MTAPILRDFPHRFESERLLIRCPLPGDGAQLRGRVLEAQEHLIPWMPWAVEVNSEEAYEEMVRQKHLDYLARKDMQLMLFLKDTDTLIGSSGLHRIDWSVPKFEIGYWIHPDFEGQGYVTEAVLAITEFAFETLEAKRVEIRCDARNVRSAAVAERAGYTLEGTLRHEARDHLTNGLRDTLVFALVRQ